MGEKGGGNGGGVSGMVVSSDVGDITFGDVWKADNSWLATEVHDVRVPILSGTTVLIWPPSDDR